ncbi:MAG: chorismate synthase, partial [Nitrosopumilus sp.]
MLPGSSIGQRLVLTSFGESHGKAIGAVLDGCPAGLEIDEKDIQVMLNQRRPGQNIISTQRKEGDIVEIIRETRRNVDAPLGIHAHNDSGCAVANSLVAIQEGCMLVQGTIN